MLHQSCPSAARKRPALPARAALRAPLLLTLGAPLAADVLVCDDPQDPTALYACVQGAGDGDTVLVRGSFRSMRIDGKSLTVVADGSAFLDSFSVYLPGSPTIRVENLGPDQHVTVRGFRTTFGVSVRDCQGSVWLDEIECLGSLGNCASGSLPGLDVVRSPRVTVTRSSFVGEHGEASGFFGAPLASPGLSAVASELSLFDCRLTGGRGSDAALGEAQQAGAAGARLDGSTLTLSGCLLIGGGGGIDAGNPCSGPHAAGGPGLELVGAPSTVRSTESTATGGSTSLEPLCPGQSGPAGPAIAGSGAILPQPGYARHLSANAPVRGGEDLRFTVEGQPGEIPWLLVSREQAPLWLQGYTGMLLVALPPAELLALPALSASGTETLTFPVPNVGLAVGALTYHVQALFLDPAPRVWLGAGTTVVLLDANL